MRKYLDFHFVKVEGSVMHLKSHFSVGAEHAYLIMIRSTALRRKKKSGARKQIGGGPGIGEDGMQRRARGFIRVIKTFYILIVVVDTQIAISIYLSNYLYLYIYIEIYREKYKITH